MDDIGSLRSIFEESIFAGLPESDLTELRANARRWTASPNECLIATGDSGDSLLVVLAGELEVVRETSEGETALARLGPGAVVGEMSLIDGSPRSATVRALTSVEILEITRAEFDRLLNRSPDASRALIRTVLRRLRSTEAMLVNQEKLAALGRVAAGLAHELNNPSSAIARFAVQLERAIERWKELAQQSGSEAGLSLIAPVLEDVVSRNGSNESNIAKPRSALEVADLEDQILHLINQCGNVSQPWVVAAQLAEAGFSTQSLQQIIERAGPGQCGTAVSLLAVQIEVRNTLDGVRESSSRIADIVSSVKQYAHMDRAAMERVDVNQGLESTLLILKHKLENVRVTREFEQVLPELIGFPAELNQVWTNLIDNAIDAMDGAGELCIRTSTDGENVIVEIVDSGGGIPQENLARVFEPFFTTKPVGAGTGLGLHIAHTIVVHRHRGKIDVSSVPGRSEFKISIPLAR